MSPPLRRHLTERFIRTLFRVSSCHRRGAYDETIFIRPDHPFTSFFTPHCVPPMNYRSFALVFHFIFFRLALGLSPKYRACQFQKPSGESALTGCPKGTLYVSPSDPQANFSSVQEAINSL